MAKTFLPLMEIKGNTLSELKVNIFGLFMVTSKLPVLTPRTISDVHQTTHDL
jgi:hypothetical protein